MYAGTDPLRSAHPMNEPLDREKVTLGLAPTDPERAARRQESKSEATETQRFAIEAARLIADSHCEEVVIFDVRRLSQLTGYIIIASGTSDRQMKSVVQDVVELSADYGLDPYGSERDTDTRWLVVDFVDVMVHLFEPTTRAHYDLEMLWGDAPQVSWQRSG